MILGAICARGGSKRLPRKSLRMLHGKPLIRWTVDCAKQCGFDRLIVSTDDEEIASVCDDVEVQMRPAELATDTASKWDVFKHLMDVNPCDFIVDLDTGVPARTPADVAACLAWTELYDVVTTGYEAERNPYFNMAQVIDGVGRVVCGSGITRGQDAPFVYSLSPAVFVISDFALYKYNHWSESKLLKIVPMPRERAIDIDTELDFRIVEALWKPS